MQGKSTTLIRGDLIDFASRQTEARALATAFEIGEKSAEVIVGGDSVGLQPTAGNEPRAPAGPVRERPHRRTEPIGAFGQEQLTQALTPTG